MRKKQKNTSINNKGITLIALVITIVVLIILATVAINLTIGNNGIINKAKGSTSDTKLARHYEDIEIEIGSATAEYYSGNTNTFSDILIGLLEKKGYPVDAEIGTDGIGTLTVETSDGYIITINVDNNKPKTTIDRDESGKANYNATIIYNANGGTGSIPNQPARSGKKNKLKMNGFSNGNYTFVGWSRSENGNVLKDNKIELQANETEVTVYAVWADEAKMEFIRIINEDGQYGISDMNDILQDKELLQKIANSEKATEYFVNNITIPTDGYSQTSHRNANFCDGNNTSTFTLPEGIYIIKFSGNTPTYSTVSVTAKDGFEIKINTNTYLCSIKSQLVVVHYMNMRGNMKEIFVNYKKMD